MGSRFTNLCPTEPTMSPYTVCSLNTQLISIDPESLFCFQTLRWVRCEMGEKLNTQCQLGCWMLFSTLLVVSVALCQSVGAKLCHCYRQALCKEVFHPIALEEYFCMQSRSPLDKPKVPERNHIKLLVRFVSCYVAYHPTAPHRWSGSDFWLSVQLDQRNAHQMLPLIASDSSSFCNAPVFQFNICCCVPCGNGCIWNLSLLERGAGDKEGADTTEKRKEDFYPNFRWPKFSPISHTHPPE